MIDSPIFDSVKTQFEKLRKGPHIHLEDLMRLELPVSIGRVEFMHLPVLFKMDENRDGKFSFQDVVTFSQFFNDEAKVFRDFEIGGRINGIACSEFAALCRSDRGVECMFSQFIEKCFPHSCDEVGYPAHHIGGCACPRSLISA